MIQLFVSCKYQTHLTLEIDYHHMYHANDSLLTYITHMFDICSLQISHLLVYYALFVHNIEYIRNYII